MYAYSCFRQNVILNIWFKSHRVPKNIFQVHSAVWGRDLDKNEWTRSTTISKRDEDAEIDVQSDKGGKIRNEHIRGTTGVVQASKKITENN